MISRAAKLALLACGISLPLAAAMEPAQVYRGTAHDALFGMCLDGEQGIAVGVGGLVIESEDGGQSWSSIPPFTRSALLDVSCGEGPNLIVAQEGGIFQRDGDAFNRIDAGTDARLLAVDGNTAGLAFTVGSFGTILKSQDGGSTWEPVALDWEAILNDFVEPHLYDVIVDENGVVTIVGEFELVVRSTDGGTTWETAHIGDASLFGMNLTEDGNGFAVGQEGRVIKTSDGGLSWTQVDTPADGILLSVWSSGDGKVLISGIRNLLLSNDNGASWTELEGGDLHIGWYQGLEIINRDGSSGKSALLAGHQGSIIEVPLN